MRMIIMTTGGAEAARAIDGGIYSVDPLPIIAGPYAGKEAVQESLLTDPRYATYVSALSVFPVQEINPSVAWPSAD